MKTQSVLTRADYEDYLVYLYFGALPNGDYLSKCIMRAYRDFNRTLRRLRIVETKKDLYQEAQRIICEQLELLRQPQTRPSDQEAFDNWHRSCCEQLVARYSDHHHHMYIGQAQKWINMSLKYIFALGEKRISGFQPVYPFCHAPLDSILIDRFQVYHAPLDTFLIERFQPYNPPTLPLRWSRIDDYDQYLAYQQWIRQTFSLLPLDLEFRLWLQAAPPSTDDINADSR